MNAIGSALGIHPSCSARPCSYSPTRWASSRDSSGNVTTFACGLTTSTIIALAGYSTVEGRLNRFECEDSNGIIHDLLKRRMTGASVLRILIVFSIIKRFGIVAALSRFVHLAALIIDNSDPAVREEDTE